MYQPERSVLMPLSKIFKKWHRHQKPKKSFDDLKVTIDAKEELSEEEKEVIISIVRDGAKDGDELRDTAIFISVYLDCRVSVNLEEFDDGVKVNIF